MFRVLKTDLSLRPVFHQKDENTEAHLFLGLLAYQLVSLIRYELKRHNIHHDWRNIVRIMNTQKLVTTSMKTKDGKLIRIKKSGLPRVKVSEIYDALNFRYQPYGMKKSVVPET
jgi:transposase